MTLQRKGELKMSNEKIKRCPFCGDYARPLYRPDVENGWWQIACVYCGASGNEYPTEQEAIAAWNGRA